MGVFGRGVALGRIGFDNKIFEEISKNRSKEEEGRGESGEELEEESREESMSRGEEREREEEGEGEGGGWWWWRKWRVVLAHLVKEGRGFAEKREVINWRSGLVLL